jgi:hypothetical protein
VTGASSDDACGTLTRFFFLAEVVFGAAARSPPAVRVPGGAGLPCRADMIRSDWFTLSITNRLASATASARPCSKMIRSAAGSVCFV